MQGTLHLETMKSKEIVSKRSVPFAGFPQLLLPELTQVT